MPSKQYRLRDELAFMQRDHAHDGPAPEELAAPLRQQLATVAKLLMAINSSHETVVIAAQPRSIPANRDTQFWAKQTLPVS